MRNPEFITFTGIDDRTCENALFQISQRWPVEFAMLLSRDRQGKDSRYPGGDAQSRFMWAADNFKVAAHICGSWSVEIMDDDGGIPRLPIDFHYCSRVQINHRNPDLARAEAFGKGWGVQTIVQVRGGFIAPSASQYLFDQSGGRGTVPDSWPAHPGDQLVGYAGGIGPDNVVDVVKAIDATGPYWLDMETGVRTGDWFDLAKVEKVCAAVFG